MQALRVRSAGCESEQLPQNRACERAEGRMERLAAPTAELLPFPERPGLVIRSDLKLLHALHHGDLLQVHTVPSSVKSNVESKPNKYSLHSLELCL